jgi:hypothetical protein
LNRNVVAQTRGPGSLRLFGLQCIAAISFLTSCGGSATSSTPIAGQNRFGTIERGTSSCPCLYVASKNKRITVFPIGATGNVRPSQDIANARRLLAPSDVAVDSSRNIYVANEGFNAVNVYPAGATGRAKPMAVIAGSHTGLDAPVGVAISPVNGDIYVANYLGPSVTFYAPGSTGNVAPLGEIAGSYAQLSGISSITLDPSGNIYVPTDNAILVFAAGSNGNVAPAKTIAGSYTELDDATQVALDSSLNIYVSNVDPQTLTSKLLVYAAGANGNVPPIETIAGANTELNMTEGVAVDASGNIYAANEDAITIYAAGSNGNVTPTSTIQGRRTKLVNSRGIVIR